MTTFVGIRSKIRRAAQHMQELRALTDRLCSEVRASIVHEVHNEDEKQVWVYRGKTPTVPIECSVIAGEVLYNLRSALDHLVWQLVIRNGARPGRHNEFPIADSPNDWHGAKDKLEGVSQNDLALIERLQPYTGGLGFPFNVRYFRTLNNLCNIDKHRHLLLGIVTTEGPEPLDFGVNIQKPPTGKPLQGWAPYGLVKEGQVLLCFNSTEAVIEPSFSIDIRFREKERPHEIAGTVSHTLEECHKAVRGAVTVLTSPHGSSSVGSQLPP